MLLQNSPNCHRASIITLSKLGSNASAHPMSSNLRTLDFLKLHHGCTCKKKLHGKCCNRFWKAELRINQKTNAIAIADKSGNFPLKRFIALRLMAFFWIISSIARIYIYRSYCGANWRSSDAFSASRHIFWTCWSTKYILQEAEKGAKLQSFKKIMGNLILQLIW